MTATPAQVANDMAAQAKYWRGRDEAIESACRAATRVIRGYLAGEQQDGRTVAGAIQQCHNQMARGSMSTYPAILNSLSRAQATICELRNADRARK